LREAGARLLEALTHRKARDASRLSPPRVRHARCPGNLQPPPEPLPVETDRVAEVLEAERPRPVGARDVRERVEPGAATAAGPGLDLCRRPTLAIVHSGH